MTDKKTLFQEKAKTYMCCFCDQCPRHNQCLRYEVGQYADPQQHVVTSINPRYQKAADGTCEYFRDNQPVLMPVGMQQRFYFDMPQHTMRQIKNRLIAALGRTVYYQYHGGRRPITPQVHDLIQTTCQQAGWTQPLRFDSETENFVW